jgi:hypothetical protein
MFKVKPLKKEHKKNKNNVVNNYSLDKIHNDRIDKYEKEIKDINVYKKKIKVFRKGVFTF